MVQLTAPGRAAFLAILLGQRTAEDFELRLTTRAGFDDEGLAANFPEPRGIIGYTTQLLRSEEWTLFGEEAIALAKHWRLLPGPIPIIIFSAVLVGMKSGVLYGIEAFDEPITVAGGGVELEVAPHIILTAWKG